MVPPLKTAGHIEPIGHENAAVVEQRLGTIRAVKRAEVKSLFVMHLFGSEGVRSFKSGL